MPYLTDWIAREAEREGTEFSVTLVLDGSVVSGMTTRSAAYHEWLSRLTHQALHGSEYPADGADLFRFVEAANALQAEDCESYPKLYLRDVLVVAGGTVLPDRLPFLEVAADKVCGLTLIPLQVTRQDVSGTSTNLHPARIGG